MDNTAPARDEATAHNDARIAAAERNKATMQSELATAAAHLGPVIRDLVDWFGGVIELRFRTPSEETTADLARLNRIAGIVQAQVSAAQKATNEAMWVSRREFPEGD